MTVLRSALIVLLSLVLLDGFVFFYGLFADSSGHIRLEDVLILLADTCLPATLIYLVVAHGRTDRRLQALERQITALARSQAVAPPPAQPEVEPAREGLQAPPIPGKQAVPAAAAMPLPRAARVQRTPGSAGIMRRLSGWIAANWVLVVAAVSLGLAGVFLVQYGIEQGLLTPPMRVAGALLLGVGLIGAGEWVRRRWGDTGSDTAAIPSAFAAGGLASLSAGILAGHLLYGLIGTWPAFGALVLIAALAVALGWFYGPFLGAAGIAGAVAVPFLVTPDPGAGALFGYLGLVTIAGLLIDTVRRWAWVSVLALVLGFLAAAVVYNVGGNGPGLIGFGIVVALAAASIPARHWRPDHPGPALLPALAESRPGALSFPTWLAAGAFAAACLAAFAVAGDAPTALEVWIGLGGIGVLYVIAAVWFRPAPGLADLGVLPVVAFLLILLSQGLDAGPLFSGARWVDPFIGLQPDGYANLEQTPGWTVTILVAMALAGAAIGTWRGIAPGGLRRWWSAGAAALPLATVIVLHLTWAPEVNFGPGGAARWAFHVMAAAALMVACAERTARADGRSSGRVALFVLSAITLTAFALALVLGPVPLTLAMGTLALAASLIDRRFDMRLLGIFTAAASGLILWRLGLPAGIAMASRAPILDVVTAYGGVLALLAGTAIALQTRNRWRVRVVVEAAGWTLLAILAALLADRALPGGLGSHQGMGILAAIWLASAGHVWLRRSFRALPPRPGLVIAALHLTVAFAAILLGVSFLNPALGGEPVQGPPVADTLLVAYALPGLVLAGLAWRLPGLAGWARAVGWAASGALLALYAGLEIRRFWQGNYMAGGGISDGELYSYTVAMLIAAAGLLYAAFARRSVVLRRVAMTGIALTIAKVFLIDMAGLTGLLRVVSFLGLGLALAGLAWFDRRIAALWDRKRPGA